MYRFGHLLQGIYVVASVIGLCTISVLFLSTVLLYNVYITSYYIVNNYKLLCVRYSEPTTLHFSPL